MKCAIEIVSLFSFNLSECESEGFATTFYGELMNGNHEFTDKKHIRNFIRKVFPDYSFVRFESANGKLLALIADAEDYEYYATEGMGRAAFYHHYKEVFF
jgi:hypothetical protein